ncbi:MAG: T9SS type A sorting domain-containing protein [Chitinophagaceae bacterium]|nr:T9SS type A sorting domain-containing protein [Chitinophagaceae bacterium]
MKKLLVALMMMCGLSALSQSDQTLYFPKVQLEGINEAKLISFLKQQYPELALPDVQMKLSFYKQALGSVHYTFEIRYQQMPLFKSMVKVNADLQGRIYSVKKEHSDLSALAHSDLQGQADYWSRLPLKSYIQKHLEGNWPVQNQGLIIYPVEGVPQVVLKAEVWNKSVDRTLIIDAAGNLLEDIDHARHFKKDTLINGKVFNPDPLTTQSKIYGGIFRDDADANSSWFGASYIPKTVQATFETNNNVFYLENDYVVIEDFEAPSLNPVQGLTPDFIFNRSESGFEDVNVLYHITNYHNYISSLGYDTLMDLQLSVDAHGQLGADNSQFVRNGGNPTLSLGTGGVDDGEDADVIIHEYAHGLCWSANNNLNFSFERSGLDEGLSDYFAMSYSRSISNHNWHYVFTWDGHNEYWPGRVCNTTNNYPSSGNIYAVGELWSSAMSALWSDLGGTLTDRLMLESMHYFTDATTLPEAATYILQADTILYGGIHSVQICNRFSQRNILNGNCLSANVVSFDQDDNGLYVYPNPANEMLNVECLMFNEGDVTLELYNVLGQTVMSKSIPKGTKKAELDVKGMPEGVYMLKVGGMMRKVVVE